MQPQMTAVFASARRAPVSKRGPVDHLLVCGGEAIEYHSRRTELGSSLSSLSESLSISMMVGFRSTASSISSSPSVSCVLGSRGREGAVPTVRRYSEANDKANQVAKGRFADEY